MNHCVIEGKVSKAPTIRYTQDQKTPIAEMEILFESLRPDDAPNELKVVGWGNIAQNLQNQIKTGQKIIAEGQLRMNTFTREDGSKEKRAELTLSKIHNLSENISPNNQSEEITAPSSNANSSSNNMERGSMSSSSEPSNDESTANWNSSPLVPDTDEIPF
tara:strand:- start:45 stop:527 length:483 start_codon:yes stop_codon:yes gene_type:complete